MTGFYEMSNYEWMLIEGGIDWGRVAQASLIGTATGAAGGAVSGAGGLVSGAVGSVLNQL